MTQAQMQSLGFGSESVYNVTYRGNELSAINPEKLDVEYIYLSEVCENCKQYNLTAILWDATSTYKQGVVDTNGHYRLG